MTAVINAVEKWLSSLKDYLVPLITALFGTIALAIGYVTLILGAAAREEWNQILRASGDTNTIYGVIFIDSALPLFAVIAMILYLITVATFDDVRESRRSNTGECPSQDDGGNGRGRRYVK